MQLTEVHAHLSELLDDTGEIPDNTIELVPVKNKVKKWAAENAYLLIFIAVYGMTSNIVFGIFYYYVTN